MMTKWRASGRVAATTRQTQQQEALLVVPIHGNRDQEEDEAEAGAPTRSWGETPLERKRGDVAGAEAVKSA